MAHGIADGVKVRQRLGARRSAARMLVQLAEALAGQAVDVRVSPGCQRHAGVLGTHACQQLAVRADERRQEARLDVDVEVREDRQPGLDADANGVHEGAVEVEEDGARARGSAIGGVVMSSLPRAGPAYRARLGRELLGQGRRAP